MSSYLLFCCIYFDAWCITCRGICARFAGGGVRFHTDVFVIQYTLQKDKTEHAGTILSKTEY